MADKTFIPTTGAQTWSNTANWNGAALPVDGDRVIIRSGDASLVITAGSTQAGIQLAELILMDTFLGSFDVDVQFDVARIGFPSGSSNGNGGTPKCTLTSGTYAGTVIVYKTGASTDATSGLPAVRWSGTHASGNSVYVFGGSVGIGIDLSASIVTNLAIQGGTVQVGANSTSKFTTLTNGTLNHDGLSNAAGTLTVSGGTLTTAGDTLHPTISVYGGTANLNHRKTGGDDSTTVIGYGGTINLQGNPASFVVTNGITLNPGASLQHFALSQVGGGGVLIPSPGKITASAA